MSKRFKFDKWVNACHWYVLPLVVVSSYRSGKAVYGSRVLEVELGWLCFSCNFRWL